MRTVPRFRRRACNWARRRAAAGCYFVDYTWIYNSFGFKTWRIGNQDLTRGRHLTFQTGTPWHRSEGAGISAEKTCAPDARLSGLRTCPPITASDPTSDARPGTANGGVGVRLFPAGAEGHRTADEYTVNLSGAWGFPMGYRDVRGKLRVEVLNATNQQRRRDWDGQGEVYTVRRFFQRPRTIRANIKFRLDRNGRTSGPRPRGSEEPRGRGLRPSPLSPSCSRKALHLRMVGRRSRQGSSSGGRGESDHWADE